MRLQTGLITKHVISESINWSPQPRFYLQGTSPLSWIKRIHLRAASTIDPHVGPTVVNFRNDYWTVTATAGYIINDKTDVHADYSFFRANDYFQ
jgi:hypothetical protein